MIRTYYYNGKAYRKSTSKNVYNYAIYYPVEDRLAAYSGDGKNTRTEYDRIMGCVAQDKKNGRYSDWDRRHEGGEIVRITYIEN